MCERYAVCGGCGPWLKGAPAVATDSRCADVIAVEIESKTDGALRLAVTVRSDDSGWDGYTDRWEVVVDDEVVGTRVLTHPHVDEQPFTRSQGGIEVGTGAVVVRAHHSTGGFCGVALDVAVPTD